MERAGTSADRGERRDERGVWTRSLHTVLPSRMSEREKGAFVYKGAGRRSRMAEDAVPEQRLCDSFHVQMQRCLAARNHQEKRATRFEPPARADPYRSL